MLSHPGTLCQPQPSERKRRHAEGLDKQALHGVCNNLFPYGAIKRKAARHHQADPRQAAIGPQLHCDGYHREQDGDPLRRPHRLPKRKPPHQNR